MVYNGCMIQILSRAWRYENRHICATLDFFVGDKIFFYDEEWSLTRSMTGLCSTLCHHHGIQPPHTEPLFICACGNPMCTFADYFVKHEQEKTHVMLSDFTHMGKEMHFPPVQMAHEEYISHIVKLFSEFEAFEKVSLNIEGKNENEGVSLGVREGILQNERLKNTYLSILEQAPREVPLTGDIRGHLVRAQFSELQRIARAFPWKLQDVHPCLYDASEVVRYKTCLFLGASKLAEAADLLFDKLADESLAVCFAACRALSELQILQPFQLMSELYMRKTSRGGGCVKSKRLSYTLRENRWLPFLVFLREGNLEILPPVLKSLEKLSFEREDQIVDSLLVLVENKSASLSLRQQALQLLKRVNMNKIFHVLLEDFRYGKETKAFRISLFHFLKEYPFLEIMDGFRAVAVLPDEDDEIRRLCHDVVRQHRMGYLFSPEKMFRVWIAGTAATSLFIWSFFHFSFAGFVVSVVFFLVVFFAIINKQS